MRSTKGKNILGLAIIFAQFATVPSSSFAAPVDFPALVHANAEAPLGNEITPELRARMKTKKLVFVAGVLNELAPSYFSDSLGVLRKTYGVEDSTIISPPSFSSIEKNGELLAQRFMELHAEAKRPLIIISHSKGSAETLLALLQHPELIEKGIVEKVYSLQGAFNGSPVADLLNGGGRLEPWADFLNRHLPGLRNLGTDSAKAVFSAALDNVSAREREAISQRLFYIRTSQKPGRTVFYMSGCAWYLATLKMPNDGVLITEEQKLDGLGIDLGIVKRTDHTDFVVPFPYSSKFSEVRKAFTHALVKVITE